MIWVSPRFGHPHSQNPSDVGIPFSYYLSDLGYRGYPYPQGFGKGDAQNAGMHCDTAIDKFFPLSLITVPEVFSKVNWVQFPSCL